MTDALPPTIDELKLNLVGDRLFSLFAVHEMDRRMIEERWLRNLRQVRKIYDPEVLDMIPADRSKAYPGITQFMVRGTIARLMQMLFPNTEKNYGVKASPLPDLPKEQVQQVLDSLVQEKIAAAQKQGQQLLPAQVQLTDDEIEKAIVAFAKGKAERMEVKITDDLQAMDWVTLSRQVVKSAVTYNIGIAEGPLHTKVPARSWQQNANTGAWEAVEKDKFKPLFEFRPVWDHYPDLTAVSIGKQDGKFDRHIMTRAEVEALAKRTDFFADRINTYLATHEYGNYKQRWWEAQIKGEPKAATATVTQKESRKFELLSYWGGVSGHELRSGGVEVADADLGKTFHANAWTIDNLIIKLKLSPMGENIKYHHYFVFEDDDLSILGNGQCDVLRDSQMSIGECARALLDNMSVIGPMAEVNEDLLTPGQDKTIRKHKTWLREGDGAASQYPAVRNINIESHITELIQAINLFTTMAEKESGLPPPSLGDVSGGGSEALRTTDNASAFLGAAALPIRDTVRNYDTYTVSLISALVAWNQKYDPNSTRDGDHDIIARGSTSLIAKEALGRALNEFRGTISPEEAPHINHRALLKERMQVHDLPVDDLLVTEDEANEIIQANQEKQDKAAQAQDELLAAQVEEALADAANKMALARKADGTMGVDVFEQIIAAMEAGAKARAAAGKTVADLTKAAAAAHSALHPPKPAARAK